MRNTQQFMQGKAQEKAMNISDKRKPIERKRPPEHPGIVFRDIVLPELNISISKLAESIDVNRTNLSKVLNGHANMTVNMALRLGKAVGKDGMIWHRMQVARDAWYAEREIQQINIKPVIAAE